MVLGVITISGHAADAVVGGGVCRGGRGGGGVNAFRTAIEVPGAVGGIAMPAEVCNIWPPYPGCMSHAPTMWKFGWLSVVAIIAAGPIPVNRSVGDGDNPGHYSPFPGDVEVSRSLIGQRLTACVVMTMSLPRLFASKRGWHVTVFESKRISSTLVAGTVPAPVADEVMS